MPPPVIKSASFHPFDPSLHSVEGRNAPFVVAPDQGGIMPNGAVVRNARPEFGKDVLAAAVILFPLLFAVGIALGVMIKEAYDGVPPGTYIIKLNKQLDGFGF